MPSRAPWVWGGVSSGDPWRQSLSQINERMADLEQYLQIVHREIEFGPVRGAALSVALGRSTNTGTALPTGVVDQYVLAFEMRPTQVVLVCYDGNLTADLTSQGSSILTNGPISLVSATPQSFVDSADFAAQLVTSDVSLDIKTIDSGTPTHIRATIVSLDVTQIQPL